MRFRKQLFIITLTAAILSTIIAFILPKRYKATTILFSALTNNTTRSLIDQTYESKDYIAFGDDKNSEQMMQVIRSADVMYGMAKRFDLYHRLGLLHGKDTVWDADYKLRGYYSDNVEFDMTEYQSLKITVYDVHPHNAYEMANGIVYVADSVYRAIVRQRAVATFNIVKHQYDSSKAVLKALNDSMDYYRRQGVLSYDFQVKELTKGYSDAQIKGNPADIKAIQDKLNAFAEYGRGYWDLYNALSDQYKWMLQVKAAYMEAKTNMDKVIPPFFVAERATLPDKGALPVRWLIVTISTLAAFFFGLAFLLIYEKVKLNPKAAQLSQGNTKPPSQSSNP